MKHDTWHDEALARAAARDEAMRVLAGRKLTEADLDAHQRGRMPVPPATLTHCHGPCEQGRRLCPCPQACEAEGEPFEWRDLWTDCAPAYRALAVILAVLFTLLAAGHLLATYAH